MKNIFLLNILILLSVTLKSQVINTISTTDWGTLRNSGFYESVTSISKNLPNTNFDHFWGINIAHIANKGITDKPYHWGGQIIFGINRGNPSPSMYIRSTNEQVENPLKTVPCNPIKTDHLFLGKVIP